MSAPTASAGARRLRPHDAGRLAAALQSGFGADRVGGDPLANQHLLDGLDRGDHARFVVWPEPAPLAVLYQGPSGALMAAGDPAAAPALVGAAERFDWRVLLGDAGICQALLDAGTHGFFRRRPAAREQRFMAATAATGPPRMEGLRPASAGDLELLTDFACRLHVADRMGPPISRAGRGAVRGRMQESIGAGRTWVVERGGRAVAKIDLPLYSPRRGAQMAGVFVEERWRGQGIGSQAARALVAILLDEGLPGVTLHVRADNEQAKAAYRTAGFGDRGPWTLALR